MPPNQLGLLTQAPEFIRGLLTPVYLWYWCCVILYYFRRMEFR